MLGVLDIQRVTIKHKVILAAFLLVGVFLIGSGRAHAATLNVSGSCPLEDAIMSVNNATDENSCISTGTYGTNDTITIPAGTITLTADLPTITESVSILGAGMGQTVVDGDGQYSGLSINMSEVDIHDLTVTGYADVAIDAQESNTVLENIEVDGQNATGVQFHVRFERNTAGTGTLNVNNLYIHNINATNYMGALYIIAGNSGEIDADLQSVALGDIHNTGSGNITFGIFTGVGDEGSVNANMVNISVDDVTGEDLVAPFVNMGFADDGDASVTNSLQHLTITGVRGEVGTGLATGVDSAAFWVAGQAEAGNTSNIHISIGNSLLADNLSSGISNNCSEANLNGLFGGSGTVENTITSLGHNISDDATCTSFTEDGDQQDVNNIISTLGPLQNNGGSVPTRALLAGSPAISAGSAVLGITADARGVARPSTCPSVGAYQYEGAVCVASTTNGSGSSGGAGNLADTGQGAKTSIFVGILLVSTAIATTLARRRMVYKRR